MPSLSALIARDVEKKAKSAVSTAESFKHWDTCMANKVCKPTAIVLIVIASLILFFIICVIVNCFCCAITCIENLCCCCRGRGSRSAKQQGFAPLPEPQYARQVDPVYVPQQSYQNTAYQPSDPYSYEPKIDNRYNAKY